MFKNLSLSTLNQRDNNRGFKIKHVAQICLLLGIGIWLVFQVHHSQGPDAATSHVSAKISDKIHFEDESIKLGRKDIKPAKAEQAEVDEKPQIKDSTDKSTPKTKKESADGENETKTDNKESQDDKKNDNDSSPTTDVDSDEYDLREDGKWGLGLAPSPSMTGKYVHPIEEDDNETKTEEEMLSFSNNNGKSNEVMHISENIDPGVVSAPSPTEGPDPSAVLDQEEEVLYQEEEGALNTVMESGN